MAAAEARLVLDLESGEIDLKKRVGVRAGDVQHAVAGIEPRLLQRVADLDLGGDGVLVCVDDRDGSVGAVARVELMAGSGVVEEVGFFPAGLDRREQLAGGR